MTPEEFKQFKKQIVGMMLAYGREPKEEVVVFYADVFKEYPFESVMSALKKIAQDSRIRSMPVPGDLMQYLNPTTTDRDEGVVLCNKFLSLVQRRGRDWQDLPVYINGEPTYPGAKGESFLEFKDAFESEVGTLGWQVMRMMGGWLSVCEQFNQSDHSIVKAQVRDLTETCMRMAKAGKLETPPALPEPHKKEFIGGFVKELAAKKSMEEK